MKRFGSGDVWLWAFALIVAICIAVLVLRDPGTMQRAPRETHMTAY